MHRVLPLLGQLQRSQLSVQALTRLGSVYLFLLASATDAEHLPYIALQGMLLAVPYTLLESLVGRPMAADLVPTHWDLESWARRAAATAMLPVGAVAYVSAYIALPQASHLDRLVVVAPVLLQLPIEALFWAAGRTRSRREANLIPQLTAVGVLVGGAILAAANVRLDAAAIPGQLAVLGWLLIRRPAARGVRPGIRETLRVGTVYLITAIADLSYAVALPSVAGAAAGQGAIVVVRAMDLAFGPFHVALSATTREDIVAGRRIRWLTGPRVLTAGALLTVTAVLLASDWVRELLAPDLARLGTAVVATYCGYKGLLMVSTWLATRHMIWAVPSQFLISGIGSRVVAFGGLGVVVGWVTKTPQLFAVLLVAEAFVVAWFLYRMYRTRGAPDEPTQHEGEHMVWDGPNHTPSPSPSPPPPVSRRAALIGGAVAAGLGTAAIGAAAARGGGLTTPEDAYNVREHGAAGDGSTDDTESIQRAIDAARETGGIVFFPPGTYLTGRLILHSRVHLRGAGGDASVLRLRPGANSAIVESDGFEKLTGGHADVGITLFSIRDLALDGNSEQNPEGGYGLRVYGYGYELTEVIVFNCREDGIYSEWGPTGALPGRSHQMEARLTSVRSHSNGGYGINFNGPHDSMFLNCLAFQNRAAGFRMGGDAHGSLMVSCHAWGIEQNLAFELSSPSISCMNCYADIHGGVGVRIARNDCRWVGGLVLGYNHEPDQEIGIQLVPGTTRYEPAGTVIDTKIINCATAAVDFGADRGLSVVRATLSQPGVPDNNGQPRAGTGKGWIGTPAPTTQVEITNGLGNNEKNLVVQPAFDLRAQQAPARPGAETVRIFAREVGGRTQLCALFPSGAVQVLATEP